MKFILRDKKGHMTADQFTEICDNLPIAVSEENSHKLLYVITEESLANWIELLLHETKYLWWTPIELDTHKAADDYEKQSNYNTGV